jgi:hypothetical protein
MNQSRYGCLGLIALFLFFVFITPTYGENYVSKDIPPDEVLFKTIKLLNSKAVKWLGKFRENDKKYVVYFLTGTAVAGRTEVGGSLLVRLDTNIWILQDQIVQK